MKVLIVDDSTAVRARLVSLLSDVDGVQVVGQAPDGPSGAFAAARLRPEVVVLDIRMPGGSGLDALQHLKAANNPPTVIVLTNYPTDSHRRWCFEHGADYFFDKSTDFERVPEVLASLRRSAP